MVFVQDLECIIIHLTSLCTPKLQRTSISAVWFISTFPKFAAEKGSAEVLDPSHRAGLNKRIKY